ncbi:HK97 family phage prohead protease [Psychrobacillus sp. FSL K6-1464]|uniref:HK97 family phage prohead protease n=1 Tax=Psychrobacillus sp. FSL K6-1464 TaxID=2921545 RepID=UPI0030F7ABE8
MTVNRKEIMYRSATVELTTRDDTENENLIIEGYFAVFNSETELWRGAYEVISPTAFDDTLSNDIRALINHDTASVLGRTKPGTLALRTDSRGLWGTVKINPDDPVAMALYSRVKRGDVDQCSFGFNVIEEETEWREDDTVKWTINKADLHEVSVVTFPAYQDTSIQARHAEFDEMQERKMEQRKLQLKERLKR